MPRAPSRKLVFAVFGGVLVVGLAAGAALFVLKRDKTGTAPPPASTGGLIVQMGSGEGTNVDPRKPLRCFVGARFIGLLTLSDCAKRNGVATEALDVSVADGAGAAPSASPEPAAEAAAAGAPDGDAAQASRSGEGDCWRFQGDAWRRIGDSTPLGACVQALFSGVCEGDGGSAYGRWKGQTLRLVARSVEISQDDRTFHPLVAQSGDYCQVPAF